MKEVEDEDDDEGGSHPIITTISLHRLVAVAAGIVWGLVITRVVWPISARRKFKDGLSVLWLRMGLIWKRDPLSTLLEGESDNAYMDLREEFALQRYGKLIFSGFGISTWLTNHSVSTREHAKLCNRRIRVERTISSKRVLSNHGLNEQDAGLIPRHERDHSEGPQSLQRRNGDLKIHHRRKSPAQFSYWSFVSSIGKLPQT